MVCIYFCMRLVPPTQIFVDFPLTLTLISPSPWPSPPDGGEGTERTRSFSSSHVRFNDHDPAGVAPKDENRSHGYTRMFFD